MSVMDTFQSLGIPFPLFEAPVTEASEYCGEAVCSVCHQYAAHCFSLGIGCVLIVPCPSCHALNGLDAADCRDRPCYACGHLVPFPETSSSSIQICYGCLRSGHGAISKDTELGMISWKESLTGVTHGVPGLDRDDFPMVPLEDDWVGARLPLEHMIELLRTPSYPTWQGEQWLFCCRAPMVYVGSWDLEEFTRRAPDGDGEAYFNRIVQDVVPSLWRGEGHDETGIYVFRCQTCGQFKANWDQA